MKTEFTEVTETRKHLSFEVPPDVVDAEIERVAKGYTRTRARAGIPAGQGARVASSSSATGTRSSTTWRTT